MTVQEAITTRVSNRSFTDEPPSAELLAGLCTGSSHLFPLSPDALGTGRVGTYGVIKGRPGYVAVVADDDSMLKAGIEGETLVIELTRRGLATCWLGGTFNHRLVDTILGSAPHRRVVAVIAVGYAAAHRSMVERIMRGAVRAGTRRPVTDIIIAGVPAPYLEEAIDALRLAPSACNRQPWRLAFNPSGSIDVYGDPHDSFMMLDVGIGIAHFLLMRPDFSIARNNNPHPTLVPVATLVPAI